LKGQSSFAHFAGEEILDGSLLFENGGVNLGSFKLDYQDLLGFNADKIH
jgi:hypothetical protein